MLYIDHHMLYIDHGMLYIDHGMLYIDHGMLYIDHGMLYIDHDMLSIEEIDLHDAMVIPYKPNSIQGHTLTYAAVSPQVIPTKIVGFFL